MSGYWPFTLDTRLRPELPPIIPFEVEQLPPSLAPVAALVGWFASLSDRHVRLHSVCRPAR